MPPSRSWACEKLIPPGFLSALKEDWQEMEDELPSDVLSVRLREGLEWPGELSTGEASVWLDALIVDPAGRHAGLHSCEGDGEKHDSCAHFGLDADLACGLPSVHGLEQRDQVLPLDPSAHSGRHAYSVCGRSSGHGSGGCGCSGASAWPFQPSWHAPADDVQDWHGPARIRLRSDDHFCDEHCQLCLTECADSWA